MTKELERHEETGAPPGGFGEAVLEALTLILRAAKPGVHIWISVHEIEQKDFAALPGKPGPRARRLVAYKEPLNYFTYENGEVGDVVSVQFYRARRPKR